MNQLLDSKLIEVDDEEEKGNKSTEKQEDDALVLWDCVSLFDTEDEDSLKHEEISETNVTTRSQGLIKEDRSVLPKIKRLQENVKRIQKKATIDNCCECNCSITGFNFHIVVTFDSDISSYFKSLSTSVSKSEDTIP